MGFLDAKRAVIAALREGRVRIEPRKDRYRNLLYTGELSFTEAATIIERTRGHQASCSPHHQDAAIGIWVFRPTGWYIKFYLLDNAWFISFHKEGMV